MPDVVVVPGRMFGPAAGLVLYVSLVAERRGARVCRHEWSTAPPSVDDPCVEDWVCGEVAPDLDSAGGSPLLIGKSLGTNAARLAAERSVPAVWLTPLVTVPWVAAAMSRGTAPFLLVGGTGEELWDGAVARQLTPHVVEVEGADHGMLVLGPLGASIDVLGRIVEAVDSFLDEIGWP